MVQYLIYVPRVNYRAADPKKRAKTSETNRAAQAIEQAANQLLKEQKEPIRVYFWAEIARESGLSYEVVAKLGYGIDGGSGGFTAIRHDLTFQQAMAINQQTDTESPRL